ncbi:MAG TPA: hydrogenase maturation protease [Terriglobales bacterium]|nr:hydrogenase maturation protease [Terriglobales bacterium]
MESLSQRLQRTLQGRVCVMGVGNVDYGDDGFGVYLAEELAAAGLPDVIIAGTTPEHYLVQVAEQQFNHLLALDATDSGDDPGTVLLLNGVEIENAFPQISTHKISLGVLAKVLEEAGTRVWLLGVQPESLQPGQRLSPTMQASLKMIRGILQEVRMSQKIHQAARGGIDKVMA